MLLVLSPGTSTQWIPPRWLFGGPQNCETSPARPVSWIHWFIDSVSSHHITHTHYTSTWQLLWSPHSGQVHYPGTESGSPWVPSWRGCATRETGHEEFRGGDFGGYCPAAQGDLGRWTSSAAGVCIRLPQKAWFSLRKSWTNSHISLRNTGKGITIDLHLGEETHWIIQLNCMKEDRAEKELYHFLATAFTISHLYLGVGLHILNTTK